MQQRQVIIIVAALVVGIGMTAYAFVAGSHPASATSVPVTTMNLQEEVRTTGTVQGAQDVELSFQRSGNIAAVNATVGQTVAQGQIIASLNNADSNAQLLGAEAALQAQQLKLQGLNPGSSVGSDVQTSITNNKNNLTDKLTDGYVKVDTALTAYADALFQNSTTYPVFGTNVIQSGSTYSITTDANTAVTLNAERKNLNALLSDWNTLNQNLTTDDAITAASQKAEQTMTLAQQLLTNMASALNAPVGADATFQTLIAGYKTSIATARTTVDTAFTNLRTAEQAYASSKTPVSSYSLQLQQSAVQSAQAQVDAVSATLNQGIIRAPFAGVITEQNAKVGQIAAPGVPLVHLISQDLLQVQTYVSEADIGKITVGMPATITLDSYGPQKSWTGKVVSVATGESTINNTHGYEVVLQFDTADPQIKSGMGATIHFEVSQKNNVVAVPAQAIIRKDNTTYVTLDAGQGKQIQHEVTTGITGNNGYVEITSGLNAGDHIITFTTK